MFTTGFKFFFGLTIALAIDNVKTHFLDITICCSTVRDFLKVCRPVD